ncbi:MAG: hypothetical protein M3R57_10115 [Chloroflexota bacterium]|nr:hypothetical protein [Chloroflexota bacterium]
MTRLPLGKVVRRVGSRVARLRAERRVRRSDPGPAISLAGFGRLRPTRSIQLADALMGQIEQAADVALGEAEPGERSDGFARLRG